MSGTKHEFQTVFTVESGDGLAAIEDLSDWLEGIIALYPHPDIEWTGVVGAPCRSEADERRRILKIIRLALHARKPLQHAIEEAIKRIESGEA